MACKDRRGLSSVEDHHSSGSASDEDQNAVEVVFDPASPYRRKSSMVMRSNVGIPSHLRRAPPKPSQKTECLVHQLLDAQRHGKGGGGRKSQLTVTHPRRGHYDDGNDEEGEDEAEGGDYFDSVRARDDSAEKGLDRVVDPKCAAGGGDSSIPRGSDNHHQRDGIALDEDVIDDNNNHGRGQPEQRFWKESQAPEEAKSIAKPQVGLPVPAAGSSSYGNTTPTTTHEQVDDGQEQTNSRLLTKKQLIEMAWGVRELSRWLGSVRLRFRVKTIFIMTKACDDELVPKARAVARWLLSSKEQGTKYTIYVDGKLREDSRFDAAGLVEGIARQEDGEAGDVKRRLRYWDEDMCRARPQTFDFVITLGGDGTVLYASWLFQRIVPPVLSFALGSLGFLTKFDFDRYQETLTGAFKEGVTVSLRLRFEATVMRSQTIKRRKSSVRQAAITGPGGEAGDGDGEEEEKDTAAQRKRDLIEELIGEEKDDEHTHRPDGTFEVLNEVVVDRGPNPTMSFTEVFGDDEHFTSILADGVCVCTPTGSTAYNLAAGGSLCHPENPVMLVTAICAHTLSFRPIILPDTIVLRIGVPYDARTSSWASFDGRERIELRQGDYVTVSASRYPFATVQVPGRRGEDWINSISAKLGWNTRQKQKPLKG